MSKLRLMILLNIFSLISEKKKIQNIFSLIRDVNPPPKQYDQVEVDDSTGWDDPPEHRTA